MPTTELENTGGDTALNGAAGERGSASLFAVCPPGADPGSLDHVRTCVIADAYARFRRARGDEVLFILGLPHPAPGEGVDAGGQAEGASAGSEARRDAIRDRVEQLGCSCDWDRTFLATDPAQVRRSQQLFLTLLEKELIYRQDSRWLLRTSAYAEESSHGLDALEHWSESLIEAQRKTLGGIEGVEVDASILGGGTLPVFTPHRDSIESAAFVAVSPSHPEIGALTAQPDVASRLEWAREADWWRQDKEAKRVPAVATGLHASVPGASTLLPLVISPRVDDRYGTTAVLGVPEHDKGDREIAETLEKPAAGAWKLTKLSAKVRPAERYRVEDAVVAAPDTPGVPVPVVSCPGCGVVPVPLEQLPLLEGGTADATECECPRCQGPAQRDAATIEPRFDRLWMWLSVCAPANGGTSALPDEAEAQRWLPIDQFVGEPGGDQFLLEQRAMAKMLEDIGELPPLEAREPFTRAMVPGQVREPGEGGGELVGQAEPDVVRLAILNAAAPQRSFAWNDEPVRYSGRLLTELRAYAEPRLRDWPAPEDGIDGSTKPRRRLVKWCRVGADKVTTHLDRLE
ncbi:MAG TPA: class I tRNA ligase family protein, partial [Solirubrobacterales bacterium]|nr:class I tRNA ligase family protein [Solirubrobacterales bacterium]